jgi:prostaglandin-E synthase 1
MSLVSPALAAYVVASSVLAANQLTLWMLSSRARHQSHTTHNPEDVPLMANASLSPADPPEVARVLRAHANGQAIIVPFWVLGAVFVAVGGGALEAQIVFGVFTAARVLYSVAYLAGKQPHRTILFGVSLLVDAILIVENVRTLWA